MRAAFIYLFLLLIFRISGKRSLSHVTTFDLVLLLIIGESTQQALVGQDYSIVNASIVISTLILLEFVFTKLKCAWPFLDNVLESLPLVLIDDGRILEDRMRHEEIDLDAITAAARENHGLERLDQIKYAVLERSGGISIIPRQSS